MERKKLTKILKTVFGAHHFVFGSKDVTDIAAVINVSPEHLQELMWSGYWDEALRYWYGNHKPIGDLQFVERLWTEMVEKGEHIDLIDYPDKPIAVPKSEGDPSLYPLIHSHLFCIDNLSDAEVRKCIFWDNNPVRYEGQYMLGYHWFAYPNATDGIYSKVFARVNVVGDLVVGDGEDTSLVCIRHGRLTLTRRVADDIANVSDERLLVCL